METKNDVCNRSNSAAKSFADATPAYDFDPVERETGVSGTRNWNSDSASLAQIEPVDSLGEGESVGFLSKGIIKWLELCRFAGVPLRARNQVKKEEDQEADDVLTENVIRARGCAVAKDRRGTRIT
jgi:hypothetical protein